ncbi:MAG TPA: hydantoinase B/oxoprolinase family protein [Acidobacteriota bacterium]|nr:hydantoinase B/oxoprolinase family protein [Acidobacteriota bacterium]
MSLDATTLNIVGKALLAIAREMAVNLRRASYSTVVREARDFSVGIIDLEGNVVAQAEMIPMQTGGISEAFRPIAGRFDLRALTPDDAFITNDPFDGGQHLNDFFLYTPIFVDDAPIGFGASVAHHVEIGGGMPGLNAEATELYQEGIRLPASQFSISRDWNRGFVEQFIRANVRVPDKVLGDMNAQFAANNTADRRVRELAEKYGTETVVQVMDGLQDYAERRIRQGIGQIPDGVYTGEDFVEAAPWGLDPVRIAARVTVEGTAVHVDFAGTDEQVPANINCPVASTISSVQAAIRGVLHESDIPFNGGCNRPITVDVPYGTILNPRPPAAVRARMNPGSRVYNAVVRALSEAVPERVIATGNDTTTAIALSHLDRQTGEYGIVIEIVGGGWGAAPTHDGMDGLDNPMANCANAPVEALELEAPYFRVVAYRLRPDSGGPGRQRGGLGIERSYEALRDGVIFAAYSDRHDAGPAGLFGGEPGGTGAFNLVLHDGGKKRLPCVASAVLRRGDVIEVLSGGGGGYGRPAERTGAAAERDVRERKVSGRARRRSPDPAIGI